MKLFRHSLPIVFLGGVAGIGVAAVALRSERATPTAPVVPAPSPAAAGAALLARVPTAFVPNLGQWEHGARFLARIGAMTVFLEEKGWTFTLVERRAKKVPDGEPARGVAVRMNFAGAKTPQVAPEDPLPGRHNYFLGNDPTKWRSDVPLYRAVRYRELHPGVDVRAREHDGHFEYDLVLQPCAELDLVEIAVEGIERMRLDADGALVLETRVGPVRMPAPLSWEEGQSGERSAITCNYVLRGEGRFGFAVGGRRPDWALVVDPGLLWSTFIGSTSYEQAYALALDAQGAVAVAGVTTSATFPTTPGAFDRIHNGSGDAFVTKLTPTGSTLVYSTFVGGSGSDYATALALDGQGGATMAGQTGSTNFATTAGAFDTSYNGGSGSFGDAFVTRLSATGSSLVYSTFLGGSGGDGARALALDAQGAATVAGLAGSSDFPTTPGAFDTSFSGGDAFVTRVSATGASLVYSTFLGGTAGDFANALVLDGQGVATIAGNTGSTDFPTVPGAFDTTHNGGFSDAFVSQLSPSGSSLVYSTFLGGTGGSGIEGAYALAVDRQGAAVVVGNTDATDFPTTLGAFDTSHNGGTYDGFVTQLSPTGSSLVYSTFLGGTGGDSPSAVAIDAQGAATVAGGTDSSDFPTTLGAFDTSLDGSSDVFVTRVSQTGARLLYSTFLGGTNHDQRPGGFALDSQGAATVAGWTQSADFPTTAGAFDTSYNGGTDAFVTRLDMLPTGVAAFGRSSSGCTGPLAMSVTSMPSVGNAAFALTCGNAPPSTTGALVLAAAGLVTPIPLLGVEVWLDPFGAFFLSFSASSNSVGAADFALPIPGNPALSGQRLAAQFLWAGPTAPVPCPPLGFSASNALELTIQP